MDKKLKIIMISLIVIILLAITILSLTFKKPKIECGNGIYETWKKGIVDGSIYYYDSENKLLATCPSDGFNASNECINLNKQCRDYKQSQPK